jgi:hypothetical protein
MRTHRIQHSAGVGWISLAYTSHTPALTKNGGSNFQRLHKDCGMPWWQANELLKLPS